MFVLRKTGGAFTGSQKVLTCDYFSIISVFIYFSNFLYSIHVCCEFMFCVVFVEILHNLNFILATACFAVLFV